MIILLSNDDGVYATGINILYEELSKIAEVFIVAPDRERSASSHSLTIERPLRVSRIKPNIYSVDGTPTDAVNIAVNYILKDKKPDMVISGINYGGNICDDVIYSGTVSAAMEGAIMGIKSIAVSLVVNKGGGYLPNDLSQEEDVEASFRKASEFVSKLAVVTYNSGFPEYTLLNVNIPQTIINKKDSFEYRITRQGKRHFKDFVTEKTDPRGRKYYWIYGEEIVFDRIPGSDYEAVHEGIISITPIHIDMTNHSALDKLKDINFY